MFFSQKTAVFEYEEFHFLIWYLVGDSSRDRSFPAGRNPIMNISSNTKQFPDCSLELELVTINSESAAPVLLKPQCSHTHQQRSSEHVDSLLQMWYASPGSIFLTSF